MTTARIRIGTRGSQLALWQANETSRACSRCRLRAGDRHRSRRPATSGTTSRSPRSAAKACSSKSSKRRSSAARSTSPCTVSRTCRRSSPSTSRWPAFLERADPRDAWVHPSTVKPIAEHARRLGRSARAPRAAARNCAQLFPHLRIEDIRGNVDTRISKAREGQYAGLVLAAAGLTRLGRADEITSYFSIDEMLPAAGQGIVAIECLAANERRTETPHARSITRPASVRRSTNAASCRNSERNSTATPQSPCIAILDATLSPRSSPIAPGCVIRVSARQDAGRAASSSLRSELRSRRRVAASRKRHA